MLRGGSALTCRGILVLLLVGLVPWEGPVRADTVPYRQYTAFDGLPSENITALAQAPNDLLWIGTETGVAVFDGHEIRRIGLPDSVGTTYVSTLRALPDGSVWVTPSQGEAVKVRHHGVERVVNLGDRIVQQTLVRQDTVFFVTRRAVWRLPPGAEQARRQPFRYDIRPSAVGATSDVGAGVFNAGVGPDGTIWVVDGHLGPGRLRSDGSVAFVGAPRKAPGNFWYDVQFAADGTGLVLQGEQLHRLDPATGAIGPVIDGLGSPTHLSVQGARAYVTRNHTLLRYDVGADRWRSSLGPAQGLPDRIPGEVLRDRDGGLWIGTKEGLLHLMAPEARHRRSVNGQSIFNIVQFLEHGSTLWARTYGTGLVQLRPTRRRVTPNGLVGWRQRVHSRGPGLHAIATETREWYRWTQEADWQRVAATDGALEGVVGADGNGYFLHDAGLYRHAPDGASAPTQLAAWPPDSTHRHDLALFPGGDLLHRAGPHLLRRRRPDGAVLDTVAVLTDNPRRNVSQIVVGPGGHVWCAFRYGGLLYVGPRANTEAMILDDQQVWNLEVVNDTTLLASTRQEGVFVVDTRTHTVRRQLTRADGLSSNTVMATHLAADTLYLGHDNGVTRLPARRFEQIPASPPTLLTGMEVNFDERRPTADSVLAAADRSVGFAYTGPSLSRADRVRYEVRLLPRDTTWSATPRRSTRYTNLEPGTYRFEVRARLGDQPPGSVAAHTFTVPPHFYETGWFRLLVGLGLLGLGVGAYRWRTHRLRRRQETLEAAVEERTRQLRHRTEELAEEKEKTEAQAERLAELDEAKNRFFAHISHEFRTPLSLILSPLRDALQRVSDGAATLSENQLRRMVSNAQRLQRLIEQLLDLATLEAGRMELERQPGDLAGLVERAAKAFGSLAEQKEIDLAVRRPDERIETRFDPEKVETMVSNLVSNALKFTPEGGSVAVRVGATDRTGAVEAPAEDERAEGTVRIEVEDTGPGIAPEAQEEVFDRFKQVDDGATRKHEGTGLGLALTSELATLHGGTVEVESTPGEGALFTVKVPLVPVAEAATPTGSGAAGEERRGAAALVEGERPAVDGRTGAETARDGAATILVVEDNAEMRAYLRDELGRHWHVLEATDGADGWETVQAERPDLVVSDVMMPEVDGFELCGRIKADPELRAIPVLLLTARADEEATLEGLESGADDYVAKPFGPEELRQRIENHLAARRHLERRYRGEVEIEALDAVLEAEEQSFAEAVLEAVEGNLGNPDFGVGDLAEEMALSRRQLTRRLKESVGEPPGEVLRRLRIERAKAHLREGAETVSEVAYAVGFRSPSSFSQSFRKAVGQSPTEYAEQHERG